MDREIDLSSYPSVLFRRLLIQYKMDRDTIRGKDDTVLSTLSPRQVFCNEVAEILNVSYRYDINTANIMAGSLLEAYNLLHRNKRLLAAAITLIDMDMIDNIPGFFEAYKDNIKKDLRSKQRDIQYMYALYREYKFVSKYYNPNQS